MITLESIEEKLDLLRLKWKEASEGKREILKRQARCLDIAKEILLKNSPQKLL